MQLSPSAQATLLMTAHLGKSTNDGPKPLSNSEWGRFALWLKKKGLTPDKLMISNLDEVLTGWEDNKINQDRISRLLSQGYILAFAVEKWQRAGLWIITRADADYPVRLKKQLKTDSPPVLFGCGNRNHLNNGGLAVIGSRNAGNEDLLFSTELGAKAARQDICIISGAARGVDEAAMLGALEAGGKAIGVVAENLLKLATGQKWRQALMNNRLTMISPYSPESEFQNRQLMARNKYIYCLSDSSLAVHSGLQGGTFNGAEENLKKKWVPLWIKPTSDKTAGNGKLVDEGGQWCEEDIKLLDVRSLNASVVRSNTKEIDKQVETFSSESNPDDISHGN